MGCIYKTDVIELKKIMVEKKLDKIVDLSEKSGIARNTLAKVINGDIQPSSNVMDKLVDTLEIAPEKAGIIFFNPNLRDE